MTKQRLLLAALVLNLGLAASYVWLWLQRPQERAHERNDFSAFYTAWSMVGHGQASALYDFDAQAREQARVVGERAPAHVLLPYLNPPHVALIFAPLARLPLGRAFAVWTLAQLGLLVWLLRLVLRLGKERPALERALLCACVLAAPPLLIILELGAFSLLIAAALLKAREALVAGRDREAGVWLAVATIKPQLVLAPLLALAAALRWRTLATTAAIGGALALWVTAAAGPAVWPAFLRALATVHQEADRLGIHPQAMYNLKGALCFAVAGASRWAPTVAGLGLAFACTTTLWLWRGEWRPADPRFDLQFAATILLGTFFSLHLYWQDGLFLVVAALLFDSYLARSGRPRTTFAAVAVLGPLIWFVTEMAMVPPRPIRSPVLLSLLLLGWMARELRRARVS